MRKRKIGRVLPLFFGVMLAFNMIMPAFTSVSAQEQSHKDESQSESYLKDVIEQQENVNKETPFLHETLRELDGDESIPVIVRFSENPVALEKGKHKLDGSKFSGAEKSAVEKKVHNEQQHFTDQAKNAGIQMDKGHSFSNVMNGMALEVSAQDVESLIEFEGVVSVYPDEEREAFSESDDEGIKAKPAMDSSIPHLGIDEIWDDGFEGEGLKVGVIDTGIDYDHPELADVYQGGKNFVEHDEDEYLNPRDGDDPYETSPVDRPDDMEPVDENGNTYETSHGTHVAGTIAAAGKNEYGIKGIAPKVDLYAYRVLGAYGTGMTSWIVAGIEEAVDEDMDIINLSLGGMGNDTDTPDADAVNNAMLSDVVTVVATGNAGPDRETIGSPATAPMAISVGNSTNPEEHRSANAEMEAGEFIDSVDMSLMGWTFGEDPTNDINDTFDVVSVPGVGEKEDYEDVEADGKFALVERGEIAFVDKIAAAKDAGALGTIIYNSEDGDNSPGPADEYLGSDFEFLPTFDMSYDDGEAFVDAIEDNDGKGEISFSDFQSEMTDGDEMSETSSRGPAQPNFDIKPDVTGPGSNIMSTVAAYQKDIPDANYEEAYERYSGTSMATPHIAGIAALLLDKNEDWSPFDVKVALSNTGKLLDSDEYDVFDQGAGRAEPIDAINPAVFASVDDEFEDVETGERGALSFGYTIPKEDEETSYTKEIDLTNQRDDIQDYSVNIEVTHQPDGDMEDAEVTVDESSFELDDTKTISLDLDLPEGESEDGDEIMGYVHLQSDEGNVSLPFAASLTPEPEFGIKDVELESYHISPNDDGHADSTDVNFEFYDMQFFSLLYYWDVLDPDGGIDGDGTVGDIYQEVGLEEGSHSVEISNEILDPDDNSEKKTIPDGVYTVELGTLTYEDDREDYDNDGPIFIVTEEPKLKVKEEDGHVSGTVDSKYFDFEEPLRSIYDLDYNPEDYIYGTYEVKDDGISVKDGEFEVDGDGEFIIDTTDLTAGSYTMDVEVTDEAENTEKDDVSFEVEEALTIDQIEPSSDQDVAAGEDVEISFKSETLEGDADFTVVFPEAGEAETNATGNMEEESPGFYKGTWTVPDNVTLDGATISVSLSKDGETESSEADGKLFITSDKTDRISGKLRYDTAVGTSKKGWDEADTVVIARGLEYADSLAGVPLAHKLDAPILLTPTDELWEAAADEIERLGASDAIILGGTDAVDDDVSSELEALGLDVERISGKDRFGTAEKIAAEVAPDGTDEVAVANGMDFPDALTVASSAAQEGMPILLAKDDWISDETMDTVSELGAEQAHVIGGTKVISDDIAAGLPDANRLSGHDRYDTNIDVLDYFEAANEHMYAATGTDYADALTGAVLAAKNGSSILLVHAKVPESTADYITDQDVKRMTTFGGTDAVSETVQEALETLLNE